MSASIVQDMNSIDFRRSTNFLFFSKFFISVQMLNSINMRFQHYLHLILRISMRKHLEDQWIDGRMILKWILRKWSDITHTRFTWFRTETSGELLWKR